MCEELMMVCLDMRMYLLKQSLVHRPRLMMSHFGHPMAAAVVAAPILSRVYIRVVMNLPLIRHVILLTVLSHVT